MKNNPDNRFKYRYAEYQRSMQSNHSFRGRLFIANDENPDYQFCMDIGMTVLHIAELVLVSPPIENEVRRVLEIWHFTEDG